MAQRRRVYIFWITLLLIGLIVNGFGRAEPLAIGDKKSASAIRNFDWTRPQPEEIAPNPNNPSGPRPYVRDVGPWSSDIQKEAQTTASTLAKNLIPDESKEADPASIFMWARPQPNEIAPNPATPWGARPYLRSVGPGYASNQGNVRDYTSAKFSGSARPRWNAIAGGNAPSAKPDKNESKNDGGAQSKIKKVASVPGDTSAKVPTSDEISGNKDAAKKETPDGEAGSQMDKRENSYPGSEESKTKTDKKDSNSSADKANKESKDQAGGGDSKKDADKTNPTSMPGDAEKDSKDKNGKDLSRAKNDKASANSDAEKSQKGTEDKGQQTADKKNSDTEKESRAANDKKEASLGGNGKEKRDAGGKKGIEGGDSESGNGPDIKNYLFSGPRSGLAGLGSNLTSAIDGVVRSAEVPQQNIISDGIGGKQVAPGFNPISQTLTKLADGASNLLKSAFSILGSFWRSGATDSPTDSAKPNSQGFSSVPGKADLSKLNPSVRGDIR